MPAIWVSIQFFKPGNNAGTDRVQVNIPDKFLQIGIFLADNGFVTILKQLAVALVAVIKTDGVTREEPSHHRGKGCQTRSEKKMGMIRDEYPCVTGRLGLGQEFSQPIEHILPIPIIYEYLSTLNPTDHDVMQDTRCVKASLSWHGIYFASTLPFVNLIFYQRPHWVPASPLGP